MQSCEQYQNYSSDVKRSRHSRFVKSNNNNSHVLSKKTNVSCSFICEVSVKKTWAEQMEFSLVKDPPCKIDHTSGRKNVLWENIFAILTSRKVLMWSIRKNRSFSRKVLLMCFKH